MGLADDFVVDCVVSSGWFVVIKRSGGNHAATASTGHNCIPIAAQSHSPFKRYHLPKAGTFLPSLLLLLTETLKWITLQPPRDKFMDICFLGTAPHIGDCPLKPGTL